MNLPRPPQRADSIYAGASLAWIIAFLGGVACIFAPIGLLFAVQLLPERSVASVVIICAISGALAVCWAAAFTISRWFIVGVVLFSVLMFGVHTAPLAPALGIEQGRPSWTTLAMIAMLVTGYVLFVLFISVQGRRTIELQKEMRLARQIHDALVPDIQRSADRFEVYGLSAPSSAMGGDLVDLVERDGAADVCLADVSGHGVRAGVVMGMLKAAMRSELRRDEPLGAVVGAVNDTIASLTPADVFATLVWIRLGADGASAELCLAGHHPALLVRSGRIERFDNEHLPLGVVPGERFGARRIGLEAGDLLACYTDGLVEAMNAGHEQFGAEAVDQAILELAPRPLPEIVRDVLERVRAHGAQADDQTMLLIRVR